MDFSDNLLPQKKPEQDPTKGQQDLLSGLGMTSTSQSHEEDLLRQFDQKASELSSFLDESNPIPPLPVTTSSGGGLGVDLLAVSSSDKSSDSSPNPPPPGLSSAGDFDLIGDFRSAGGDSSRVTEELISASRDIGQDSPTAMDMGFEQVQKDKNVFGGASGGDPMMQFGGMERTESPRLPDEPCLKPQPAVSSHGFGIETSYGMSSSSNTYEKQSAAEETKFSLDTGKGLEEFSHERTSSLESAQKDLFQEEYRQEVRGAPPIPKHAYEMEGTASPSPPPVPKHAEGPPPVPKHAEQPFIHQTYGEDDFEDDSLSRNASQKLSDSLEVLKESPQREMQLDESLMDLEELSSSKSISPAKSNLMGGDIAPEMLESTLFSQQPPTNLMEEEEEKFGFTHVSHEMEQPRPVASVTPFASVGAKEPPREETPSPQPPRMETPSPIPPPSKKEEPLFASKAYDEPQVRAPPTPEPPPPARQPEPTPIMTPTPEPKAVEVKPISKVEPSPPPKVEPEKPKPAPEPVKKTPPPPPARQPVKVPEYEVSEDILLMLNTLNPDLSECQLIQIPDAVFHLMRNVTLQRCNFSGNVITKISPKVGLRFTALIELDLSNNKLGNLPDELKSLQQLKKLDISYNAFLNLPDAVYELSGLEQLKAKRNYIEDINLERLRRGAQLQTIDLRENPLAEAFHRNANVVGENITILLTPPKKQEEWDMIPGECEDHDHHQ